MTLIMRDYVLSWTHGSPMRCGCGCVAIIDLLFWVVEHWRVKSTQSTDMIIYHTIEVPLCSINWTELAQNCDSFLLADTVKQFGTTPEGGVYIKTVKNLTIAQSHTTINVDLNSSVRIDVATDPEAVEAGEYRMLTEHTLSMNRGGEGSCFLFAQNWTLCPKIRNTVFDNSVTVLSHPSE